MRRLLFGAALVLSAATSSGTPVSAQGYYGQGYGPPPHVQEWREHRRAERRAHRRAEEQARIDAAARREAWRIERERAARREARREAWQQGYRPY